MSIKYAVLGLIAEEPRHGYAVRAAFEERLGDFWELNYGQIYQVLSALEADGLIAGSDERVGRRPTRRIFAATAQGRVELRRWIEQPLSRRTHYRDEFYVRLLFVSQYEPALLETMLSNQIKRGETHLRGLIDQRGPATHDSAEATARYLFREAAILHAESDLQALHLCQSMLAPFRQAHRTEVERPRKVRGRA